MTSKASKRGRASASESTFRAATLSGQYPGTVIMTEDQTIWVVASSVQEIVRTAARHGLLRGDRE